DGKTLVYAGYTTYGHDLWAMPIDRARFLPAVDLLPERPDPPTEPGYVHVERHPYNPLPTLAPHSYLLNIKPGNYGPNAVQFTASGGDIVGLHDINATITAEPSGPQPSFALDYYYSRLPVSFELHFFHSVVPRSGYYVNGQN